MKVSRWTGEDLILILALIVSRAQTVSPDYFRLFDCGMGGTRRRRRAETRLVEALIDVQAAGSSPRQSSSSAQEPSAVCSTHQRHVLVYTSCWSFSMVHDLKLENTQESANLVNTDHINNQQTTTYDDYD